MGAPQKSATGWGRVLVSAHRFPDRGGLRCTPQDTDSSWEKMKAVYVCFVTPGSSPPMGLRRGS